MRERAYNFVYRKARRPEDLPWHHDEPPEMLRRVVEDRGQSGGRALDIGCGAGVYATYIAKAGYEVTAIDFMPAALELARQRAEAEGVELELQQADIRQWTTDETFDIILDSGCLHGLPDDARAQYARRLPGWMREDGDYVLVHFGKRHFLDWRPIGPRRIPPEQVRALFAPLLREVDHLSIPGTAPLPIGPRHVLEHYRFQRA